LGKEVLDGEESLNAEPFPAVGIEDDLCRRPAGAETVERLTLFLDVGRDGDEILGDETNDSIVGIDLGFQPSTAPSHRRGAEVQ